MGLAQKAVAKSKIGNNSLNERQKVAKGEGREGLVMQGLKLESMQIGEGKNRMKHM